jgi:hypothetical protein
MDEDAIHDASFLAQLDQGLASSKHSLNRCVDAVRDVLKDYDESFIWLNVEAAMMEDLAKSKITVEGIVKLLATAFVQFAKKEEDNG